MSEEQKEKSFERTANVLMWSALIVIVALISLYTWEFWGTARDEKEFYAQFGDYFGGVLNPLLTFGTIFLLIKSIQFQLHELRLTRNELVNQRKELSENNATQLKISKAQENSTVLPALISSLNDNKRIIEEMLSRYVSFAVTENCGAKVYVISQLVDSKKSAHQVLFEGIIDSYVEEDGREFELPLHNVNEIYYFLGRFNNLESLLREFLDHGGSKFVAYEVSFRLGRFCHVLQDSTSEKLQQRAEGVNASMQSIIQIYFEDQPPPN